MCEYESGEERKREKEQNSRHKDWQKIKRLGVAQEQFVRRRAPGGSCLTVEIGLVLSFEALLN